MAHELRNPLVASMLALYAMRDRPVREPMVGVFNGFRAGTPQLYVARDKQLEGASRFDAALEAARVRLRPIVMTSACFVQMVPPYFANGAGTEMRRSLGTSVLWGAFGVTIFATAE